MHTIIIDEAGELVRNISPFPIFDYESGHRYEAGQTYRIVRSAFAKGQPALEVQADSKSVAAEPVAKEVVKSTSKK